MNLQNKVVIITGVASKLGKSLAYKMGKEGAIIVLLGRNHDKLHKLHIQLSTSNIQSLVVVCDVTNHEERVNGLQKVLRVFDRIDILINNVAFSFSGSLDEHSPSILHDIIHTNLTAQMQLTREVCSHMLHINSGTIFMLNMLSTAKENDKPNRMVYDTAKRGLIGFTELLQEEQKNGGINVISLNVNEYSMLEEDDVAQSSYSTNAVSELSDYVIFILMHKKKVSGQLNF